jgi:hypothetical protein
MYNDRGNMIHSKDI